MKQLSGIIASQSRYELQQRMLLNPNGLETNVTNRYGIVDVSNNVERIENLTNDKTFIPSVFAFDASREPLLDADYFGTGLNSINNYDGVTQKELGRTGENSYKIEWDVPHYVAAKIRTRSVSASAQWLYSNGSSVLGRQGSHVIASGDCTLFYMNQKTRLADNTSQSEKQIRYAIAADTNYDVICYFSGTNDANDWRLWIDGIEVTPTVVFNQSFTGKTFYPTGEETQIRIGHEVASTPTSDRDWKGRYGKMIVGYGLPNIKSIQAALNSPQ